MCFCLYWCARLFKNSKKEYGYSEGFIKIVFGVETAKTDPVTVYN